MPNAPARLCRKPNCRGLVRDGVCSVCGPVRRSGWENKNGSRQSRGYDQAWIDLRAAIIKQHMAEHGGAVVCEDCQLPIVGQVNADHRKPFAGLDDPLRLDPENIALTCTRCHMRKTQRDKR